MRSWSQQGLLPFTGKKLRFNLPDLPSVIRYYDDFNDCYRSITDPKNSDLWDISVGGSKISLNFNLHDPGLIPLLKFWASFLLQTLAPATATIRFSSLQRIPSEELWLLTETPPTALRQYWQILLAKEYTTLQLSALKSILHFLCWSNLSHWSADYLASLSNLPIRAQDKYASVRTGDVFLGLDEEAVLIAYFDELAHLIHENTDSLSDQKLRDVTILISSFQFGLRPLQIAMLRMEDIRIWKDDTDKPPSVHLNFRMIKQRIKKTAFYLPRRVKNEWAGLFAELYRRAKNQGLDGSKRFFQVKSADQTSKIIIKLTGELLPESRSATELRHSAAQRLADAGASQEELAEFLGHSDIDTALVYFQTSPNQAELVNRALGVSKIYQQVAKIGRERFISFEELAALKDDQQIGGAPHGIPISGIGGCTSGQSACSFNPIMACYGCKKFMPLHDSEVHKKVLKEFRGVVSFFAESSRGDSNSPAFLQLQKTITTLQSIITEIESGHGK